MTIVDRLRAAATHYAAEGDIGLEALLSAAAVKIDRLLSRVDELERGLIDDMSREAQTLGLE
jgi:hypothetical protein